MVCTDLAFPVFPIADRRASVADTYFIVKAFPQSFLREPLSRSRVSTLFSKGTKLFSELAHGLTSNSIVA